MTAGQRGGKMLILQRRIGESMVIGNGITITVMNVRGQVVSLGIQAPKAIGIRRGELRQHSIPIVSSNVCCHSRQIT
jgi:carbon storage regulator